MLSTGSFRPTLELTVFNVIAFTRLIDLFAMIWFLEYLQPQQLISPDNLKFLNHLKLLLKSQPEMEGRDTKETSDSVARTAVVSGLLKSPFNSVSL